MAWRDWLDWEEGLFRVLLRLRRAVGRRDVEAVGDPDRAELRFESASLRVLAQILTGEPVRIRNARGPGGLRGRDLLLPAAIDLFAAAALNRDAYRVQVVVAAGMRTLSRDRSTPAEGTFEAELASLQLASAAVQRMSETLPAFEAAHAHVIAQVLEARRTIELERLPPVERELECVRRKALSGQRPWEDPEVRARLVGPRTSRRRSPELPIWGSWFPDIADASVGVPPDSSERAGDASSEAEAPEMEALRRVPIGEEEPGDIKSVAAFERAESLDSYRGGSRQQDGSDDLQAHLDALEEVDLGDIFRGSQAADALLKADLQIGLEVADASRSQSAAGGLRYDEWDVRNKSYRRGWCTVYPRPVGEGAPNWAAERLHEHRALVVALRRRLQVHRSGLRGAPRQLDGEEIDLDAAVDDHAARRAGRSGDPRVYLRRSRRRRDFATTILLDVSMSTDSWIEGRRVLDVSREATLVLGEVAEQLRDRLQVLAFASETRNRCDVWEVLGFRDAWATGKARLPWLVPQGYTRIGPALRHATELLSREVAERRLLLLISDGKPTDYDRYEGAYGISDVRMALREASRRGIHTHALAIDSAGRDYLPALFGENGWHVLPRPEDLLEALTEVYGRLTAQG